MRLTDDHLLFSASDLVAFLDCQHLSALDLRVARGLELIGATTTATGELLAGKGDEHERDHLEALIDRGVDVVLVPSVGDGEVEQAEAVARTVEAMRAGAEVVYQAALEDGRWRGFADFLERVPVPCRAFGEYSYEVLDTKLARHAKPQHLVQLCVYSDLLGRLQGRRPEWMHAALGSGDRESFRVDEFLPLYRRLRRRYEARLAEEFAGTYPEPVGRCGLCRWSEHCAQRWEDDDHLSLVHRLDRSQRVKLGEVGITKVVRLADAAADECPEGIAPETFERLREQARAQVHERLTGARVCDPLPLQEGKGFARLPEPRLGDLFFDVEDDPFFGGGVLVYLFGVTRIEEGEPVYRAFRGTDRDRERRAFEAFVDFVVAALVDDPSVHVYHYGSHERTVLRALAERHGTRQAELKRLLGEGVLVDLLAVTREALRVSKRGYSLKLIEKFYGLERGEDLADGGDSIISFERWLDTGDQALLDAIEAYNEVDCLSTLKLHGWLLERRHEAERRFATIIQWRLARTKPEADPDAAEAEDEDEPGVSEQERLLKELSRMVGRAESSPERPESITPDAEATAEG